MRELCASITKKIMRSFDINAKFLPETLNVPTCSLVKEYGETLNVPIWSIVKDYGEVAN